MALPFFKEVVQEHSTGVVRQQWHAVAEQQQQRMPGKWGWQVMVGWPPVSADPSESQALECLVCTITAPHRPEPGICSALLHFLPCCTPTPPPTHTHPQAWLNLYSNGKSAIRVDSGGHQAGPHVFIGPADKRWGTSVM